MRETQPLHVIFVDCGFMGGFSMLDSRYSMLDEKNLLIADTLGTSFADFIFCHEGAKAQRVFLATNQHEF